MIKKIVLQWLLKEIQGAPEEKPVSESIPFSQEYIGISKTTKRGVNQMDQCIFWLKKFKVDYWGEYKGAEKEIVFNIKILNENVGLVISL